MKISKWHLHSKFLSFGDLNFSEFQFRNPRTTYNIRENKNHYEGKHLIFGHFRYIVVILTFRLYSKNRIFTKLKLTE